MKSRLTAQHSQWLAILLIIILTLSIFSPSLWNHFVNFDDTGLLSNIGWRGWSVRNILWWFANRGEADFKPMVWASYEADYTFWKLNPFGYHLGNILLHGLNAVCLYFLIRLLRGGRTAAWEICIAVLFFSLHPLRVESVAWITERKDVLCGFFYLISLLTYIRYVQSRQKQFCLGLHPRSFVRWYYIFSLLCALFAVLSKPVAVSLPAVLLLLDIFHFKRLKEHTGKFILEKIPYLLFCIVIIPLTIMGQVRAGSMISFSSMGLWSRLVLSAKSYVFYLRKTVYPINLSPLYPEDSPQFEASTLECLFALAILLMITVVCLRLLQKKISWPFFSWAWYLVTLFPVSGFFRTGVISIADRFTYLPSMGFSIAVCFALSLIKQKKKRITRLISCLLLLGLSLLTVKQIHYWKNSFTLWTRSLAFHPHSYLAHNNLGLVLFGRGEIHEALEHYREALQAKPDYIKAYSNMGLALSQLGKMGEAISCYKAALRIKPGNLLIICNLASTLFDLGRLEEAIRYYTSALREHPESIDAHLGICKVLIRQRKPDEALSRANLAVKLHPGNFEVLNNLGIVLAQQGRFDEAISCFKKLIQVASDRPDIYNNIGMIYNEQGMYDAAIENFYKALDINPDFPESHYNLGITLAHQGNIKECIHHLEKFQKLRPDYASVAQMLKSLKSHPDSTQGKE